MSVYNTLSNIHFDLKTNRKLPQREVNDITRAVNHLAHVVGMFKRAQRQYLVCFPQYQGSGQLLMEVVDKALDKYQLQVKRKVEKNQNAVLTAEEKVNKPLIPKCDDKTCEMEVIKDLVHDMLVCVELEKQITDSDSIKRANLLESDSESDPETSRTQKLDRDRTDFENILRPDADILLGENMFGKKFDYPRKKMVDMSYLLVGSVPGATYEEEEVRQNICPAKSNQTARKSTAPRTVINEPSESEESDGVDLMDSGEEYHPSQDNVDFKMTKSKKRKPSGKLPGPKSKKKRIAIKKKPVKKNPETKGKLNDPGKESQSIEGNKSPETKEPPTPDTEAGNCLELLSFIQPTTPQKENEWGNQASPLSSADDSYIKQDAKSQVYLARRDKNGMVIVKKCKECDYVERPDKLNIYPHDMKAYRSSRAHEKNIHQIECDEGEAIKLFEKWFETSKGKSSKQKVSGVIGPSKNVKETQKLFEDNAAGSKCAGSDDENVEISKAKIIDERPSDEDPETFAGNEESDSSSSDASLKERKKIKKQVKARSGTTDKKKVAKVRGVKKLSKPKLKKEEMESLDDEESIRQDAEAQVHLCKKKNGMIMLKSCKECDYAERSDGKNSYRHVAKAHGRPKDHAKLIEMRECEEEEAMCIFEKWIALARERERSGVRQSLN